MPISKLNLNKEQPKEQPKQNSPSSLDAPAEVIETASKVEPQQEQVVEPTLSPEQTQQIPKVQDTQEKPKDKKAKKAKKSKGFKKNQKDKKDLTIEEEYQAYRKRRMLVLVSLIVGLSAVVFYGLYNTFFKYELTPQDAAIYTNKYNGQMQNQKWDSGIQSYLQANLKTLLKTQFVSTTTTKDYSVDNISVERNQPVSNTMFMTFFSCDLTANGITERLFCYIFIDTTDSKMQAASDVSITSRQSFTADAELTKENKIIQFDEKKLNNDESKSFQTVLDNFLTLGYNLKQDTSNIYKGKFPLAMQGQYIGINTCSVYDEANELGFNAKATYTLEEANGFRYTNTCYMQVEKQGNNTWIITQIL